MDGDIEALLDRAEEALEIGDVQVGMEAALHHDRGPAQIERLLDLVVDLLAGEHICLGVSRLAVEGAEPAARYADVRVVDVAIDDVGGQGAGDEALAHFMGSRPHSEEVARAQQLQGFAVGHAPHGAPASPGAGPAPTGPVGLPAAGAPPLPRR